MQRIRIVNRNEIGNCFVRFGRAGERMAGGVCCLCCVETSDEGMCMEQGS